MSQEKPVEMDDSFFQTEILQRIEERLKTECEIADKIAVETVWPLGKIIDFVYLKIKCNNQNQDIILYAPIARVYNESGKYYAEMYTVDEAVYKAFASLAK
jgi:hypothetical protein